MQYYLQITLPVVDGYFWVERDNDIIDIIDPYFIQYEYDFIKEVNNLEGDRIYLKASDMVSSEIIRRYEMVCSVDIILMFMKRGYNKNNQEESCSYSYVNSVLEIDRNGGDLCFGSLGWKRVRDDRSWPDNIHWEFGGHNWKVEKFLKTKGECVKSKHNGYIRKDFHPFAKYILKLLYLKRIFQMDNVPLRKWYFYYDCNQLNGHLVRRNWVRSKYRYWDNNE